MFKLSERIKALRTEMGVSQDVLAENVGTTRVSISHYETGFQTPDGKMVAKMALYFDVSADYLLGLSDTRKANGKTATTLAKSGLSDGAIKILVNIQETELRPYFRKLPEVISFLLENEGGLKIFQNMWNFLLDEYAKPPTNGILEVKSGKAHIMELDEEQLLEMFLLNISTGLHKIKSKARKNKQNSL